MEYVSANLTRLAKLGIRMTNFYAQEVCSPSRASLLTGKLPISLGMQYGMVQTTAAWGLPLQHLTLPQILLSQNYSTHMIGKWHLGFFSPYLLPTARGFESFVGFLNGENYYWSKHSPDYPEYSDLLSANQTCYQPYSGEDKHLYSTDFYTNHALDILEQHAEKKSNNGEDPNGLFLFLSYQAVHDPFADIGKYRNGMPDSDLPPSILEAIHNDTNAQGKQRKEYLKSLYRLDEGLGRIEARLKELSMWNNTYLIFLSDNGGCMYGGGRNGPLRGSKGSLFEGGTKVESFISSPLLPPQLLGLEYSGLMHISDWFPTVLRLANIDDLVVRDLLETLPELYTDDLPDPSSFTPSNQSNYSFSLLSLDGVDQVQGWIDFYNANTSSSSNSFSPPRSFHLYNYYSHITDINFNMWTNGSVGIRDERFKLLHTFNDSTFGVWYRPDTSYEDLSDDLTNPEDLRCAQQFLSGNFTYYFFDLLTDPFETNNLYDQVREYGEGEGEGDSSRRSRILEYSDGDGDGDEYVDSLRWSSMSSLYQKLSIMSEQIETKMSIRFNKRCKNKWQELGWNILPYLDEERSTWIEMSSIKYEGISFPSYC